MSRCRDRKSVLYIYNSSCISSSIVSMMSVFLPAAIGRPQSLHTGASARINLPGRRVPEHQIQFSHYPCSLPPHHVRSFFSPFKFQILITLPFCLFVNHRSGARGDSDAPAPRLLRPAASLPGGAQRRLHREEQAGDVDLPLDAHHADLLQV